MVITYICTVQHNEPAKGAMENNAWTFTDQRKIKESAELYVKCIQQAGTA